MLDITPAEIVGLTAFAACLTGTIVNVAPAEIVGLTAFAACLAGTIASEVTFGGEGATHDG